MTVADDIVEEISLWECLHDGSLENLTHDPLGQSLTLTIDVPYIWQFHKMPDDTRFRIILQDALILEALDFQPWPGESVIPDGLPWKDQQALRYELRKKGCSTSSDWLTFARKVESSKEYEFSNGVVSPTESAQILFAGDLIDHQNYDYPNLHITAAHIGFFIGPDQELSLTEFLALGKAYWDDFAARSKALQQPA